MRTTTRLLTIGAIAVLAGCTVKDIDAPSLSGPSTLAHSIIVVADRDTLTQNGVDFTDIRITSISPTGQSENVAVRAQIQIAGVAQDFGTLSTKSLTTPATIRYTAPAASSIAAAQEPTTVTIAVTSASNGDFRGETARLLDIRLVPQGVILPTNPNLVAAFDFNPTAPQAFQTVTFDATKSTINTPPVACATACTYSWNFGDGTTGTGLTTAKVFRSPTAVAVTLTVTDARGAQASTTKTITPTTPAQPTGDFTISPSTNIATDVDVAFNATGVTWSGRTISRYDWNFGDGNRGSGMTTTNRFRGAGTFTVTLTVTDDLGAQGQLSKTVTVTTLGGATANLTASTNSPKVNARVVFDATASVPSAGAVVVTYRFIYGDGAEETSNNPVQSHTYTTTGTFVVTLVITDSNGKTATRSVTLTVSS